VVLIEHGSEMIIDSSEAPDDLAMFGELAEDGMM
jgi:hypothetical protein